MLNTGSVVHDKAQAYIPPVPNVMQQPSVPCISSIIVLAPWLQIWKLLTFFYPHHPAESSLILLRPKIISQTLELCTKLTCLHPVFGPAFTPYPLFQWYPQRKEILFNRSMKCWNSGFNTRLLLSNIYAENPFMCYSQKATVILDTNYSR
jgi:hypothetical protein